MLKNMENYRMNELIMDNVQLPVVNYGDYLMAAEPFIHADRTMHVHVLIYVTKGQITVTEEGIDYEINPGELLFLKGGLHHYGKQEIAQGTAWYYVHFYMNHRKEDTSGNHEQEHGNGEYRIYDWKKDVEESLGQEEKMEYARELPKKLTGLVGSAVEQQLKELVDGLAEGKAFRRWDCNRKLYDILSEVAFYSEKQKMPEQTISDRIVIFLEEHMADPFQAKVLEGEFYLSYKHLAAVFKQEKGITMQQYHRKLRIQCACRLLRSTSLPIGEISSEVGYGDMLYFSRCFHQTMGMSPREYRRINPMRSESYNKR